MEFNENEWEKFKNEDKISEEISGEIWSNIFSKTILRKKRIQKNRNFIIVTLFIGFIFSFSIIKLLNYKNEEVLIVNNISINNKSFYLPDSSEVNLYPNSKIEFNWDKEEKQRLIILKGKAIFKVSKNKENPFIVRTKYIEVKALGTIFLVDEKEKTQDVKVKLIEGSVVVKNINNNNNKIDLEKMEVGDLLFCKKEGENFKSQKKQIIKTTNLETIDIKNKTFIDNYIDKEILDFNHEKLYNVFKILSHVYEIEILIEHVNLDKYYFTGSISNKENIYNIINKLSSINNLNYTKYKNNIVIK